MAYDDTNRGVLFPNDRKQHDKQPDYTGKINIDGKDYRLAGWKKTSRDGSKRFLSLAVSEFQAEQPADYARGAPADFDDDIPF